MSGSSATFELDPRLDADTTLLAQFDLSLLLLMNDARYPWCILVPKRPGIREIYELSLTDQGRLLRESSMLGRAMVQAFGADKLNVAALGNLVPQLHLHHVVRFVNDDAWPAPVWGRHPARPYTAEAREQRVSLLKTHLAEATWVGRPTRPRKRCSAGLH